MNNRTYITLASASLIAFSTPTTKASSLCLEKMPHTILAASIAAAILLTSSRVSTLLALYLPSFCFTNYIKFFELNEHYDVTVSTMPLLPIGTITVSKNNHTAKDVNLLQTIYPSGTNQEIPLINKITTVEVPFFMAKVYIIEKEAPRIVIDSSFAKHIEFQIDNSGKLTFTTNANAAYNFPYNGNPLCIIYAQLANNTLTANNGAHITVKNQQLDTITCHNASHIQGSIKQGLKLRIRAHDNSHINLRAVHSDNLTITLSSSTVILAGETKNQEIVATNNGVYNGSKLINQNGNITANISYKSYASTTGLAHCQAINIDNNATYNGGRVVAKDTTAKIENNSTAIIDITNNLDGKITNNSRVLCRTFP